MDVPNVGDLSQLQASLLIGVLESGLILDYANEALEYANSTFPIGPQRDAFRHSYWMALSVSNVLVLQNDALMISTAHEHDNRDDSPHQQAFNSTMDLYNNAVGSTIVHSTMLGAPDRPSIQADIFGRYAAGMLVIWEGGGSQENSEGILIKSDGSKIYPE